MPTTHRIVFSDARQLSGIKQSSVHLIVTSPPYPMIEMWDDAFAAMNPQARAKLESGSGGEAFELMHRELDKVWKLCFKALVPGGFACINVGDATRTVGHDFGLYSNHARILQSAASIGFTALPDILWRKPTNTPNKFMGSGMYPAGAYVTYEHEYILVLRKGSKREFLTAREKSRRRGSAYFWEERNVWFSDVWSDLRGTRQILVDPGLRERSGAFPFELAFRLIQMYSLRGDTVLDPFAGTGTTCTAAAVSERNSIGVEIDSELRDAILAQLRRAPALGEDRLNERLRAHRRFIAERQAAGKELKHRNRHFGFPVTTLQETELAFAWPVNVRARNVRDGEADGQRGAQGDDVMEVEYGSHQTVRQSEFDFAASPAPDTRN